MTDQLILFNDWPIISTFKEISQHHHSERLKDQFILQRFKQLLTYAISVFFAMEPSFRGASITYKSLGLKPVEFGWISFVIGVNLYTITRSFTAYLPVNSSYP